MAPLHIHPDAEALGRSAADLVERGVLTHEGVLRAVREALRERSVGNPDTEVLHNAVPGEFDFTEEFYRFVARGMGEQQHKADTLRTDALPWLRRFGEARAEAFPGIHRMVRACCGNRLESVFANVRRRRRVSDGLDALEATLATAGDDAFGADDVPDKWPSVLGAQIPAFIAKHSKGSILRWVAETRAAMAAQARDDGVTPEKEARVAAYLDTRRVSTELHLSFAEAVEVHGEASAAVWDSQSRFDARVMGYLLAHPDDWPPGEGDEHLEMGMLFAAEAYCRLHVTRVPALVGWRIRDHDGMEVVQQL